MLDKKMVGLVTTLFKKYHSTTYYIALHFKELLNERTITTFHWGVY